MTDEAAALPSFGRRDYQGKSALQRNSSHVALLWLCVFLTLIYFVLPLLSLPTPTIPDRVWELLGLVLGIAKWKSGNADIEANKAAA